MQRGNKTLKNLDRQLGIPLVQLLGRFKSLRVRRVVCQPYQHIGLMKTAAIGDTVLLTAILQDIRHTYPMAKITLFTGKSNYEFARQYSGADEVIELPLSFKDIFRAIGLLRHQQLDVLLDFGAWPRINSILSFFSGAGWTVGFKTAGQQRDAVYDEVIEHSAKQHELDNYRALAGRIGLKIGCFPKLCDLSPLSEKSVQVPYLVFHAWPGGEKSELKEWPTESWLTLAREMQSLGYDIYFTGALVDQDKTQALIEAGQMLGMTGLHSAVGNSLRSTVELIRGAQALVSVNTGIMHVGAALGDAVVGISGPTSVRRWGAVSPQAINVSPELPGCGYLNLGFEYPDTPPPCMACISAGTVKDALLRALLLNSKETL